MMFVCLAICDDLLALTLINVMYKCSLLMSSDGNLIQSLLFLSVLFRAEYWNVVDMKFYVVSTILPLMNQY